MKSPQEFRLAVYDKREKKAAAAKRVKKRLLLCAPLALAVVCGALFLPRLMGGTPPLSSGRIPLALQVGRPAEVRRVDYSYYQELLDAMGKQPEDLTQQDQDALDEAFDRAVTENRRISPEFQSALNDFARDATVLLSRGFDENDCCSPLSLYYALALTGAGARGETEREFLDLLRVPDSAWAADQCAKYYRQHSGTTDIVTFQLANSLWMDGRCTFDRDFIANAEGNFYSSLFQADFTQPAVAGEMTNWVKENTNGLLAPEFSYSPDRLLTVLSALYFHSRWGEDFSKQLTESGDFTRRDGSTVTVDFMHQTDPFGTAFRGKGFTGASRYLCGGFRMIFILPDEGVDPRDLLQDPAAFEEMFYPREEDGEFFCKVVWSLPKFSFDSRHDLLDTLKELGLSSAADGERADFSGIYETLPPSCENLYLSAIDQGVHIAVDEAGVKAAAYTEIASEGAAAEPPEEEVEMKLDRPFLFAIAAGDEVSQPVENRYYSSGHSLLFVGICGDPSD